MTAPLRIELPESTLEISCDHAAVGAELDPLLFPTLRRSGEGGSGVLRYAVRSDGPKLHLFDAAGPVGTADSVAELVPLLHSVVDGAVVQRLNRSCAIHAGVVSFANGAAILPAGSHHGKSTLVAELLKAGCGYFSDEYALIDDEGRVHPYPRALLLRNGTGTQLPVPASAFGAGTGGAPLTPRLIASVVYAPEACWQVSPVLQSEMVVTLLRNTPHHSSAVLLARFARAVGAAACLAGLRGEAPDAARRIVELLA